MSEQRENKRRRFRFRLRTLLLLPVLFALGWLWTSWPERTARRFVETLAQHDLDAARGMSDLPRPFATFWAFAESDGVTFRPPMVATPSWSEWITGRRSFLIPWTGEPGGRGDLRMFVAQTGRVSLSPSNGGNLGINYQLRRLPAKSVGDVLAVVFGLTPGKATGTTNFQYSADQANNMVLVAFPDEQQSVAREVLKQLGESVPDLPPPAREPADN